MKSKNWLIYKLLVFYCFLSSARACMTLGDNQWVDMALALVGFALMQPHCSYQITFPKIWASLFLGLAAMYTMHYGNITGYFAQLCMVLIPIQIIFLKPEYQLNLFESLSKWYAILLTASVIWWVLWLLGVPLPNITQKLSWQVNNYGYLNQNYFLFRNSINLSPNIPPVNLYRFNGFFLEPGHIGTITSLFLFANRFDLRKRINIIYLMVIILSFSAAAYVLTALGYFLYRFSDKPSKIILPLILTLIGIVVISSYNGGDNAINEYIFGKITREQGAIDGRFSKQTQLVWDKTVASGDIFWGLGTIQLKNSAGYKVYLIMNGIFGAFLTIMAYWFILRSNYSKIGFCMLTVIIISFLQRTYPFWDAFLDPYILGTAYLQFNQNIYDQRIEIQDSKSERLIG